MTYPEAIVVLDLDRKWPGIVQWATLELAKVTVMAWPWAA